MINSIFMPKALKHDNFPPICIRGGGLQPLQAPPPPLQENSAMMGRMLKLNLIIKFKRPLKLKLTPANSLRAPYVRVELLS